MSSHILHIDSDYGYVLNKNMIKEYVDEIPKLEEYIKKLYIIQNLFNKLDQGEQIKYETLDEWLQKSEIIKKTYSVLYPNLIEKEHRKSSNVSLFSYMDYTSFDLDNIPQILFDESNKQWQDFRGCYYNNEGIEPFQLYIQKQKKLPPNNWFDFQKKDYPPQLNKYTVQTIIENNIDLEPLRNYVDKDIFEIWIRNIIEHSIDIFKKLPQIKGITEDDIHKHMKEVVYAFYKNNLDVPQELQFEGWVNTPSVQYAGKRYLQQYTPYQSWIIFNHNSTIPPKELYYKDAEKTKINEAYPWGLWIQNNHTLPPNELRFDGWEYTKSTIHNTESSDDITGNPYKLLSIYFDKYDE